MFVRMETKLRSLASLLITCVLILSAGCADEPLAPSGETSPLDQAVPQLLACYGGPNTIFPAGTCGTGPSFEPGGPIVGGTSCTENGISFEAIPDFTKTTSINRGLFTPYCGNFARRTVTAFTFTVQDYLNLRAANPNPQNGDYTITTSFASNVGQMYWWQSPLINGTTAGRTGVLTRFIAEDPQGNIFPVVLEGRFEFVVFPFTGPCGTARGWLIFDKNCLDAAIIGLPGTKVLFEISYRSC